MSDYICKTCGHQRAEHATDLVAMPCEHKGCACEAYEGEHPKVYTQQELDALIAGAYIAADALIAKGAHSHQCASLRDQSHIDPEACDCPNGLLRASVRELTPDAARLALEEARNEWGMPYAAIEGYCAEREAKLTADTRLEESKFWWNVHRSLSHEGVSNCSMCEHHSSNIAALRAAVQEPQNET